LTVTLIFFADTVHVGAINSSSVGETTGRSITSAAAPVGTNESNEFSNSDEVGNSSVTERTEEEYYDLLFEDAEPNCGRQLGSLPLSYRDKDGFFYLEDKTFRSNPARDQ
jgi:hypothetical protein